MWRSGVSVLWLVWGCSSTPDGAERSRESASVVDSGASVVDSDGSSVDTATSTDRTQDSAVTGSGSVSDAPTEAQLDEQAARAAIAGEREVADVLAEVAWRGGWPVQTEAGTFLFLRQSEDPHGLSIAGDFNAWEPTPMTSGSGLAWAELTVAAPRGSGYKFVHDAVYFADPWARSFTYDDFGELSFVRPSAEDWRLDRWPDAQAAGLPPRPVHALVPPGEGPWPVLYAQDGQNLFDPSGMFGGWNLQGVLPEASDPVLVVGTFAGPDRLSEYAHVDDSVHAMDGTGRLDDYTELLVGVVRPKMEQVYGVGPVTGLLGSSMGGVASLGIAHAHPEDWDFVASMSGTLGWGRFSADGPTMQELYLDAPPDVVVYVDSGGAPGPHGCRDLNGDGSYADDPDHTDNYCTNRAFADALADDGWIWNETIFHWHAPGEPHNEIAWGGRVHRPIGIFLELARAR
ncbi:MAG: hypothetical protein EA397_01785 [Deltaproteobacteria bacterium]|nr:MAG: hypothetical protein EA397_01785 [Deltaproteobacteria bacterium]